MCVSKLVYAEGDVVARGSDYQLQYLTPPLLLYGGTSLVTSVDVRAIEANCSVKVGWRTANVILDLPNAWQSPLGTSRTTNDKFLESFDVSGATGALLVQVGVFAALTTGATPKGARTRVWASVKGAGFVIAQQRINIQQTSSTLSVPVGKPVCAAGLTGMMAGMVILGVQGTIVAPTFVWRGFDSGDPRMPNSWSTILAGSNVTSDSQIVAAGSITTTSVQMAQPGVQYSTSGTNPNGVVDFLVAGKM